MSPLYVFLASSLNVELVYIILTSICSFAYLIKDENGRLTFDLRATARSETSVKCNQAEVLDEGEDSSLLLREIQIENAG